MTIEVFGHVRSLETYAMGKVLVTLGIEVSRVPDESTTRSGPTIKVIASNEETESYRPGMGIRIVIQPHDYARTSGETKS